MDISYTTEAWKIISGVYTLEDIKKMYENKEISEYDYTILKWMFKGNDNYNEESDNISYNQDNKDEKEKEEENDDDDDSSDDNSGGGNDDNGGGDD